MKKILGATLGLLIMLAPLVAAKENLPDPGVKPGDFLYGFDRALEGLQLTFAFDKVSKARLHYQFAEERLAEVQALSEDGKMDLAEATLNDYEDELAKTNMDLETAVASGENPESLTNEISERSFLHVKVLTNVHAIVPEQAKLRIQQVIERSLESQGNAVRHVDNKDVVTTTVAVGNELITVEVPAEIAERISEGAEAVPLEVHQPIDTTAIGS